jgi:hypothetical protein
VAYPKKTIPIGQLFLDVENPRHEPAASQRDAIQALIESQRQKLVVLASDILEYGLSPIDRLLVIQKGRNFTVVEGNRRLAVAKMLENPSLADGTPIEQPMKRLAEKGPAPIDADCAIAPSRKEAEHWMELRHAGESEGAGVVPWNALAANRFSHKPGSQAARAISFLEVVRNGYPKNEIIQDLCERVARKRLTTLGRLVSDPNFRARSGLVEDEGDISFHFPAAALQDLFEYILGDLAADVSVSQLKSKGQRSDYLKTAPKPASDQRISEPKPLTDKPPSKPQPKPKPKPKPKPTVPFQELSLDHLGSKTQALLSEFRSLKAEKVPHAAAILVRSILELSVDEFIDARNLTRKEKLRHRIRTCLEHIDPKGKREEFKAVRSGLQDGTSLYAVATLHGFVHNQYFHADGMTVRSIAANIEPFLQELNDCV